MPLRRLRAQPAFGQDPEINLTPLIDVLFVILIMFMVLAPLLETDRIELASKEAAERAPDLQQEGPVAIRVYKTNEVRLNGKSVSLPQLGALLRREREKSPGARPQLFQDKEASFGTYQRVKNSVEAAGFEELDIILQPE